MKLQSLILGIAMALGLGLGAQAQSSALLDGSDVDEIVELARNYGHAELETQPNGDPKLKGTIEGITYVVYFMNCPNNWDCEDLNFYAGFLDLKPKMDAINAWNRDKRFGKAYLDADGDAVIEMDLNLEPGVSAENLAAGFAVWSLVLQQYVDHIGYKP